MIGEVHGLKLVGKFAMSKLSLQFLGVGGFFGPTYHSNILLNIDGKNLLLDCGSDIRHSLADSPYDWSDIDAVYISHLHGDHVGGLETLAYANKFINNGKKIPLFIHRSMISTLWTMLHPSLSNVKGCCVLNDYFLVNVVDDSFWYNAMKFDLVRNLHIKTKYEPYMYSYGLFFKDIYWSSDTCEINKYYCDKAKIIFHDCETLDKPSGVHTHYNELFKNPNFVKMVLYHYSKSQDEGCFAGTYQKFDL